ncbi:MAG: AAA family ATPase [Mycobacterium sp.]
MVTSRQVSRPIRGREPEVALIGALIAKLGQGRGGVLIVEGPPGIGKSRLLAESRTLAERAGIRTLFGQAYEYQQAVPFYSLFTATMDADPPIVDPEALRVLSNSADLSYWVVHDLDRAIRAAATKNPLLIQLEDVHWADAGTLVALRELTAVHDSPVLWTLSLRAGSGGPVASDTVSALERNGAQIVRLAAMPRPGVIDMIEDRVRARADVSLLNLAEKAHGNPFLVTELLGGLNEESRLRIARGCAVATGDSLPQRLSANMRHRLDALSDTSKEVVQVAAVLPDLFTVALLARMLERQPAVLMSAVEEAVRADLLVEDGDHLKFRHDLLREATRQSLPPSLRRAVERQTATVMLDMGAAPAEVATQLSRSADVGDQAAITALRQAAQHMANSEKSSAADLSRRALDLLPSGDPQRGALVAETIELLNASARYPEAKELTLATISQLSPEDEARARLRTPTAADAVEERVAENRLALQLSQISDVTRARHQAWLACQCAVSGLPYNESTITDAVASAEATGDPESRIVSELTVAIVDYVAGHVVRALDRLEKLHLDGDVSDPIAADFLVDVHYVNLLSYVGRSEEATAVLTRGVETSRREGSEMASVLWASLSAMIHLTAGRLSTARETLDAVTPHFWGSLSEMSMNRSLVLAEVAVHVGDRKLLHDTIGWARAANPDGASLVNRGAAYVLALAAWDRGEVHDAVRWLSRNGEQVLNPLLPNAFEQLILTAQVAVVAGDAGLRARVLRSVEMFEHNGDDLQLLSAAIGLTRGILERDVTALVDAAVSLRTVRPLLSARAAEEAGSASLHTGSNAHAIDQLNDAFDWYVESEAVADARRVARVLSRFGVHRRAGAHPRDKAGWDSLTDAELKVVNLLTDGATNSAVAERLHISPNTVKSHVRSAFAKLGVNSRAQLPGLSPNPGPR